MCHLPLQGTIRVWDVATADALATLRPHDADGVGDAGAIAAAAAHDDTARRLGTGGVLCLATSGAAVWSGSDDGELSLWALAPPYVRLRRVADAGAGGRVACLAVMGEHLWSAGQHAAVRVWSRDGALLKELSGHTSYVHALCKVVVARVTIRLSHQSRPLPPYGTMRDLTRGASRSHRRRCALREGVVRHGAHVLELLGRRQVAARLGAAHRRRIGPRGGARRTAGAHTTACCPACALFFTRVVCAQRARGVLCSSGRAVSSWLR